MNPTASQKARRLSLTKVQRHSEVGLELVALCQTVTADGSLSEAEVRDLNSWLDENQGSDLPAIEFLTETVRRVLADGKVTSEERGAVLAALEKVLPPDLRKEAVSRRKAVEATERAAAQELKEEEKQRAREEAERNRPIASHNFMVAGVRYDGRPALIAKYVSPEDTVLLRRDFANKFSPNAVEVVTRSGHVVGFVPEQFAIEVAPLLDSGARQEAFFTKVLTAAVAPIPVVQVHFYRAEGQPGPTWPEERVPSVPATGLAIPEPDRPSAWKYIALAAIAALAATFYVLAYR